MTVDAGPEWLKDEPHANAEAKARRYVESRLHGAGLDSQDRGVREPSRAGYRANRVSMARAPLS